MQWISPFLNWIQRHDELVTCAFVASLVMFLLSPVVVGLIVIRLPADYFTAERRHPTASWQQHRVLRPVVLIVKNVMGIVMLLAGVVMLVTPGQGLLTIVVGLTLVDFPGKQRFERWLATRPAVWRSINWLRKRAGRDALQNPG